MSKFWGAVATLFIAGLVLLVSSEEIQGGRSGISFSELENECRLDSSERTDTDLTVSDTLTFEGNVHVNSVESTPDYNYIKKGNTITLNVFVESSQYPSDYWDSCKGVVKYKAETERVEKGEYFVKVLHNGEKVDEKVYKVN